VLPGVFLIAAGLVFLIPSHSAPAQWLLRLWPGFLVLAGIVSVMGFAVERKPRSPIGGTVLMVVGVLLLISRFQAGMNPIQLYGRYWPVLLVIFAGVEMVRHYSHRPYEAPRKPAFRFSRLFIVGLIMATGLIANHIATTRPSLLSAIHLPRYLNDFRDSVTGQQYSFSDPAMVLTDVAAGARIAVDNSFGDVKLVGGGPAFRVTLTKGVRAWSEDEARDTAANIKLVVNRSGDGINITTNRNDVDGQFTTGIEIELPASAGVSINDRYGSVAASRTQCPLNINAANCQVAVDNSVGGVTMALQNSNVDASRLTGDLSITGAKRVVASQVQGGVDLSANNGSVELHDVTGRVRVDAPFSRIRADGLSQAAEIRTRHGAVEIARAASLTIDAPNSQVRAENISGDLTVNSSREPVRVRLVQGEVRVTATGSPVTAEEVRGPVHVGTSNSAVSIMNFYGAVTVQTSYSQVLLVAAIKPVSDIDVENNHGEIKLTVPAASDFTLDAASANGFIRPLGFAGFPEGSRNSLILPAGVGGPTIRLRTSYRDITLMAAGGNSPAQRPDA
jgi:DUF4097 and DUF4098 domain-containing protein YvlB